MEIDKIYPKLRRMAELQAIHDSPLLGVIEEKSYWDEWGVLKDELLPICLPLLKSIAAAGLIEIQIKLDNREGLEELRSINCKPTAIFEDGPIWISGDFDGCGMGRNNATNQEEDE
jgi:hypothetical protein